MTIADLLEILDFNRAKTMATLDAVAKLPDPAKALGWRPGPGRAHLAWQLMHIAATDDRHVHARMTGGQPQEAENVRRFAGGSTPDDNIPSVDEVRRYLTVQRENVKSYLAKLDPAMLDKKPIEAAPWTHREWIKVLAWHEAHHQGQAHITLNLYKAANA
jgi:DinB superfamily